jgi:hypothetical protein
MQKRCYFCFSRHYRPVSISFFKKIKNAAALYPVLRNLSRKEAHLLVGAGAVTRCGSGSDGSGSDNGIKHG